MSSDGAGVSEAEIPETRNERIRLRYFEDILPIEFAAILKRRQRLSGKEGKPWRGWIVPLAPKEDERRPGVDEHRRQSPGSDRVRDQLRALRRGEPPSSPEQLSRPADPDRPDYDRTRPKPFPCTVNGLALSGGGIRSAAVCLGALQALNEHRRIQDIDYLSTVSGGGYIGSCLSAAMSEWRGDEFPFEADVDLFPLGADKFDSRAVAHLRNYSNYLLPRGRSSVRNFADAAAVLVRGLLANMVLVFATVLGAALLTLLAYPRTDALRGGSFLPRLLDGLSAHHDGDAINQFVSAFPLSLTLWSIGVSAIMLIAWALLRSFPRVDFFSDDANSVALTIARVLVVWTLVMLFLDLQPLAIAWVASLLDRMKKGAVHSSWLPYLTGALTAFGTLISLLSSWLGHFLKTSARTTKLTTIILRLATYAALVVAALVMPAALWLVYLLLSLWGMPDWLASHEGSWAASVFGKTSPQVWNIYLATFVALAFVSLLLSANGYSLHRLYRDRLSKAFLFDTRWSTPDGEPRALDRLKLSQLADSSAPYQILNSAMNVQGSAEANRRGRNADFFMFTRDFVGSDLTLYGPTKETFATTADMEHIDPRLDLATAMAISGAAVSANMGASTVRLLSPTLALLNVRLGYWMRNPRDLARDATMPTKLRNLLSRILDKFYLVAEMLNWLSETSRNVYLTDGGHIENLGVYELLKRGCQNIIVIDAEADPSMSFGSLLTLERYARIDFGIRIVLP